MIGSSQLAKLFIFYCTPMITPQGNCTLSDPAQVQGGDNTACPGDVDLESIDYWSKLSASYSESGDRTAALHARQKAVEIARRLYADQPDLGESPLARELLELSKNLASNGRIVEAFEASQESGLLYRQILGELFLNLEIESTFSTEDIYDSANQQRITFLSVAGRFSRFSLVSTAVACIVAFITSTVSRMRLDASPEDLLL
ncbi:unnamed protein product [Rhizoctonia solani]|nr:unnamed protein product [Rhizoctonia solani]